MKPTICTPFGPGDLADVQKHVAEIRRIYAWPGSPYHEPQEFNRWHWHNLPLLRALHHQPGLAQTVEQAVGEPVRPSYCFLAMYGPQGVVPRHTDRPMCQYTVDWMVSTDARQNLWPLRIEYALETGEAEEDQAKLQVGQAVIYSGTEHPHQRASMSLSSDATFANLVFFHFVPRAWQGPVD